MHKTLYNILGDILRLRNTMSEHSIVENLKTFNSSSMGISRGERANLCWAEQVWRMGMVNLALSACVLRSSTKKGSSTFLRKKSAPSEKIVATPMTPSPLYVSARK